MKPEKANALALSRVHQLKTLGAKLDCYSFKSNGKSQGSATEDCDIAIDVHGDWTSRTVEDAVDKVYNPYRKEKDDQLYDITRIKFNF